MEVAKITNLEEFLKVTAAYRDQLVEKGKALASTLKELRLKLDNFINKHLIKLNKEALKDSARLSSLLEFLLLVDSEIPT